MKYVSLLFATLLIAGIANASNTKELMFNYSNYNVHYACDYAEAQMANVLNKLGMEVVTVACEGGITEMGMFPVAVHTTFNQTAKGERTVVLKGREACDFHVKMIKAVLAVVDHKDLKAKSSCNDAQGSYRFEVTLN